MPLPRLFACELKSEIAEGRMGNKSWYKQTQTWNWNYSEIEVIVGKEAYLVLRTRAIVCCKSLVSPLAALQTGHVYFLSDFAFCLPSSPTHLWWYQVLQRSHSVMIVSVAELLWQQQCSAFSSSSSFSEPESLSSSFSSVLADSRCKILITSDIYNSVQDLGLPVLWCCTSASFWCPC